MAEDLTQIAHLLNSTLSPDAAAVRAATDLLDRFSVNPQFPFHLLTLSAGAGNQGQKIAAATYLKNLTRRNVSSSGEKPSNVSKEFKEQLMQVLLQVELSVLKILVEVFRPIVAADFVKQNLWPELVPNLQAAIQNSHLINGSNTKWNTVNALIVLHALIRPFQYFLNPKVAKEPVPPQLELISKEILVPLLAVFHQFVEKALATHVIAENETEKVLLTICKCLHFAVKSYMPSTLAPLLPSFCRDLMSILSSLSFDGTVNQDDEYLTRLKTGKRSLLIFSALVTRHRKHSDKLMPEIIKCVLNIVKFSKNTSQLPFLSERLMSLGFDVISNILETGPGWRLVSPHFSTLLESAIFPALVLNEKDMSEWEEDPDEYIRKNLPSDIDEICGWREDLFTARKSAVNLLGVISISKGPPMETATDSLSASSKRKKGQKNKKTNQRRSMGELLVLPFLSKFPIPSDSNLSQKILNDYFGVLMAYGGLQDFLREQEPEFVTTLVRTRILPLYTVAVSQPYLVASANWILGELGSCLPEEMCADVYYQLLMALVMPDRQGPSCYPVRVSAAGAISTLLDNDYMPPEFLPLLQVIIGSIAKDEIENESESSILFQLLSSIMEAGDEKVAVHIPHIVSSIVGSVSKWLTVNMEPWPQVVESAIGALAVMGQTWENSRPEESDLDEARDKWTADHVTIARAFAELLQQAWLTPPCTLDQQAPPSSCIENLSTLLQSVLLSIDGNHMIQELKVSELVSVWAEMIAEWHAWEESEDLSIFEVIKEIVNIDSRYRLNNFIVKDMPPAPAPPVPERSIVEGIGAFISEAIKQYPSATFRACSCVHILLHCPTYSPETECVRQSLAVAFSQAAISRLIEVQSTTGALWKPLLLAISSCYLCYPDIVEGILEKGKRGGITIWASALCDVCNRSSEPGLTAESEMKLTVMALARLIEQLLKQGKSGDEIQSCFTSLLELSIRLKEARDGKDEHGSDDAEEDSDNEEDEDEDDDTDNDDYEEDSGTEEYEETEEEFLKRYAKAAEALENGSAIEEGDDEDQELELEIGQLMDIDEQMVLSSLIDQYHHVLIRGLVLPSELVVNFLNAFPVYDSYFNQYR